MNKTIGLLSFILLITASSCRKDLVYPEMMGDYDYTYSGVGTTYTDVKTQGSYGIRLEEKKAYVFKNGEQIEKCKVIYNPTTQILQIVRKKGETITGRIYEQDFVVDFPVANEKNHFIKQN